MKSHWTNNILDIDGGFPIDGFNGQGIYTPDDIFAGADPAGPVVIYDFNYYYMGSAITEFLRHRGKDVIYVTPANSVAAWTFMNNEAGDIRARMIDLGVEVILEQYVTQFRDGNANLISIYPDREKKNIDSMAFKKFILQMI